MPPINIPRVLAWLAEHPRWTFHFTPTSCAPGSMPWKASSPSSLGRASNEVSFASVDDLEKRDYPLHRRHQQCTLKPFVCTATAKTIQAKLKLNHPSESVHSRIAADNSLFHGALVRRF